MAKKKQLSSAEWATTFLTTGRYVFRRGHHHEWNGRCYCQIPDILMLRRISNFISQVDAPAATSHMVKNVAETIAQMTAIDDEQTEPVDLTQQGRRNIVPFRNGFLFVDDYLDWKLNDASLHPPF